MADNTLDKGADVNLDDNCFYHYECFVDVCFDSDGKGDVHYDSFRPAITT